MNVLAVNIVASIVLLVLGLFAYLSNPRKTVNRHFIISVISIIAWLIIRDASSYREDSATIWMDRFSVAVSPLMAVSFYFFTKSFLELGQKIDRKIDTAVVLPAIFTLIISPPTALYVKWVALHDEYGFLIEVGPFYYLNTVYIFCTIVFCVGLFVYAFLHSKDASIRRRIRTILTGICIALTVNIVSDVYFIMIMSESNALLHTAISVSGFIAYAACVAYSILRHGLFNIRRVVARAVTYFCLMLLLFAVYGALIIFITDSALGLPVSSLRLLFSVFAVMVVTFTTPYIKSYFDRITRHIFYADSYNSQEIMAALNSIFARNYELEKSMPSSLNVITQSLHLKKAELVIFDRLKTLHFDGEGIIRNAKLPTQRLKSLYRHRGSVLFDEDLEDNPELRNILTQHEYAAVILLSTKENNEGYLMIGAKRNGSIFYKKDEELFLLLSKSLAIAIQNAKQYKVIEEFAHTLKVEVEKATEKLNASNLKLRKLDEAKNDFISMASHQLMPQVTALQGMVDLMSENSIADKEILAQIKLSGRRMQALISTMLNVTKIESGAFHVTKARNDLITLVRQEIDDLSRIAQRKGVAFKFVCPKKVELDMDREKMREAIFNILENAVKYSEKGDNIHVEICREKDRWELSIQDTGIGIAAEDLNQVFTKFYRASNATIKAPMGNGVGLYVAKNIIESHGFTIKVTSKIGQGTRFSILL